MPLKNSLWRDTVAQLHQKELCAVSPVMSIRDAVATMQRRRSGCLVVQEAGRPVGIFTERDVLKRVVHPRLDMGRPISSVMTANPTVVRQDEAIGSVIQKMLDGRHRHMPVVDASGRATGQISVADVVHYMVEFFPKAVYNLPPSPNQVQLAPEGA